MARVPLHILTGYLGTGKTTLLNRVLASDRDSAVVVNELGDVAVDHALVSHTDDDIAVLSSGCLCCQLEGSWTETLARLRAHHPRRIIVELSGAADPRPIVSGLAFGPLAAAHDVGSVVAALEAPRGDALLDDPLARAQLECATRIVVTKADLAAARVEPLLRRVAGELPGIPCAVAGELDDPFAPSPRSLPGAAEREAWLAGHPASDAHRATTVELGPRVDLDALVLALRLVVQFDATRLVRVKGLVRDAGDRVWCVESVERSVLPPRPLSQRDLASSRLVLITRGADDDLHAYAARTLTSAARGERRA